MRKLLIISLVLGTLVFVLTGCSSVYKKGVEYPEYPEKDLPVYNDATVFFYEKGTAEIEISFGSEDDVDDVMDFYQDFFEDEKIILSEEKEDKDEYSAEGQINDFIFELEIEEPRGDQKDYYKSVTTINIEFNYSVENSEDPDASAQNNMNTTADQEDDSETIVTNNNESDSVLHLALEGPGNTPANLLHGGLAAEYDGYIYYVDEMYAGNLWRMPVGGGESELLIKGTFHDINVNGGYIFTIGDIINTETGLYSSGIYMISIDGSTVNAVKEGYFEELILYDEYLYFADVVEGGLYRMKYDGSGEELLAENIYSDFAVVNDNIYIYASLGEEYMTNIYKMPLDGSSEPEMIVTDTFGGSMDVAMGRIFYILRDNNLNGMYNYNTATSETNVFVDTWLDDINSDGEYLYYYWSGVRQDNSDQGVYRMNPDGTGAEMILNVDYAFDLNIAGGKIFWFAYDEQRRITIMNLDGTGAEFLEQAVE